MKCSIFLVNLILFILQISLQNSLKLFSAANTKFDFNFLSNKPEVKMTIDQLVVHRGFHLQTHYVNTTDGYVLKVFRIKANKKEENKVVLLQHGLFDSSDSWIVNKAELSLPFSLVKEGYDVWLGNNRGNKHSRNHTVLNPDSDKQFWNFSFHEMGTLDLPAMIDYIIKFSHVEKVSYVGHSQGTAQLFAGIASMPDYFHKRINGFAALGPVTALNNIQTSFINFMAKYRIESFFSFMGIHEILPSPDSVNKFASILCDKLSVLCSGLLELLSEADPNDDDKESLLVFISHFPSGASLQTLSHYSTILRNKKFVKSNEEEYNLDNLKNFPVALLVGKHDKLSTVDDNRLLRNKLLELNSLHYYKEYDNMGHITFFLNKNSEYLNDVLRCLNDFNKLK